MYFFLFKISQEFRQNYYLSQRFLDMLLFNRLVPVFLCDCPGFLHDSTKTFLDVFLVVVFHLVFFAAVRAFKDLVFLVVSRFSV